MSTALLDLFRRLLPREGAEQADSPLARTLQERFGEMPSHVLADGELHFLAHDRVLERQVLVRGLRVEGPRGWVEETCRADIELAQVVEHPRLGAPLGSILAWPWVLTVEPAPSEPTLREISGRPVLHPRPFLLLRYLVEALDALEAAHVRGYSHGNLQAHDLVIRAVGGVCVSGWGFQSAARPAATQAARVMGDLRALAGAFWALSDSNVKRGGIAAVIKQVLAYQLSKTGFATAAHMRTALLDGMRSTIEHTQVATPEPRLPESADPEDSLGATLIPLRLRGTEHPSTPLAVLRREVPRVEHEAPEPEAPWLSIPDSQAPARKAAVVVRDDGVQVLEDWDLAIPAPQVRITELECPDLGRNAFFISTPEAALLVDPCPSSLDLLGLEERTLVRGVLETSTTGSAALASAQLHADEPTPGEVVAAALGCPRIGPSGHSEAVLTPVGEDEQAKSGTWQLVVEVLAVPNHPDLVAYRIGGHLLSGLQVWLDGEDDLPDDLQYRDSGVDRVLDIAEAGAVLSKR